MKRVASLLVVVSLVLLAAPSAMAACWICRFSYATCYPAADTNPAAWTQCTDGGGECYLDGSPCGVSERATTPLASEFTIAAVERLDDPQPQAEARAALVATAETPASR